MWLDDWELRPGDSLIDRIFTQGLAAADVIIVILSSNSVNSSWVKEELNTAAIRKIKGQCRIIPIVLDDVEVPSVLSDTVYLRIPNCSSYNQEFQRILDGIYGQSISPPIGNPPAYIRDRVGTWDDGLKAGSRFILKEMLKREADSGGLPLDSEELEEIRHTGDISDHMFRKEISRLERQGYIEVRRYLGGGIACRLCPSGTLIGWALSGTNIDSAKNHIAVSIIEFAERGSEPSVLDLAENTGQPAALVDAIVSYWEGGGYLKVTRAFGGLRATRIWWVDPLFEDELT